MSNQKARMMSAATRRGGALASIFAAAMLMVLANSVYGDGPSDHQPTFRITFTGFGSSTDTGAPCVDLTCSGSDSCDCTTGSASGPLHGKAIKVTYEFSMDTTDALNDGASNGKCMPATGNGIITFADKSTLTFVMSGIDCDGIFNGTLRLTGGSADHGRFRGLGSIEIGSIDSNATAMGGAAGNTTGSSTVQVTVDASGGFQ
jgi:hypothetical protein